MSDDEQTTTERNRAIALEVNDILGSVEDDVYLAYYNDDPVWHVNRTAITGRDGLRKLNALSRRAFPHGIEREIQSTVAEGDRVVIQHVNRAVTAYGANYENEYVKIFEFDPDGRIRSVWEYLDSRYAVEMLTPPDPTS